MPRPSNHSAPRAPKSGAQAARSRASGRARGSARASLDRAANTLPAVAVALAALAALWGHLQFLLHAGALWRDECNLVAFAGMRSLAELGASLGLDSVPLGSTLLVRAWMAAGLRSDAELRLLGCLIGLATLMALWRSSRVFGSALPASAIALIALNPWMIRGGDALRPGGLGTLFLLLAFAAVGAALQRPSPQRAALAMLWGVLCVQCLYT
ncbi:MAG: hypothetical protein ACRENS_13975, partial [Candidatus Eiseniibacteriota bacterium]